MAVRPSGRATALRDLRQAGSLKCLFPRGSDGALQAMLVNTAGGVTGGDRFTLDATAEPGSQLTITTQAAERAYRAQPGEVGTLRTRLDVGAGARLNWMPQETILFDGCALTRSLTVDLAPDASLLLAEPLVFGRLAMGETLRNARFRDRVEIRRAGRPAYLDATAWQGDVQAQLDRPGVAGGARACTSLVYVSPDAEARLDPLRRLMPDRAGASLLADDMLVMRLLADDSYAMRAALIPILTLLSPDGLPRCWML